MIRRRGSKPNTSPNASLSKQPSVSDSSSLAAFLLKNCSSDLGELPDAFVEVIKSQFVRYGDVVKLSAHSHYLKTHINKTKTKNLTAPLSTAKFLGVYEKLDGTTRVAIPPIGKNAPGTFTEARYRVEPAEEKGTGKGDGRVGESVRYGDVVVLVDADGLVWNNKAGGFFEGYLVPQERGTPGEVFVEFHKAGKMGSELLYNDPGVYIDVVVSHRYRTSFNNRLTNYRTSKSKCFGGYVCSDGRGFELAVSVDSYRPGKRSSPGKSSVDGRPRLQRATSNLRKRRPPQIKVVSVMRREGWEDVMVNRPQFDALIKVYNVRNGDQIKFVLEDESTLVIAGNAISKVNKGDNKLIPLIPPQGEKAVLNSLEVSWEREQSRVREAPGIAASEKSLAAVALQFAKLCLLYIVLMFLPAVSRTVVRVASGEQTDVVEVLGSIVRDTVEIGLPWRSAAFLCWLLGLMTPGLLMPEGQSSTQEEEKNVWSFYACASAICYQVENSDEEEGDSKGEEKEQDEEGDGLTCSWRAAGKDKHGVPKHLAFQRFLIGEENNMRVALERWERTLQWREEKELDSILEQAHVKFDVIKKFYPHSFVGRSKTGNPIYNERPGGIDLKGLKKAGVTTDDLLWHNVFLTEYQWRRLEPVEGAPTAKSLCILDIAGVGLRDLAGEVVSYMKQTIQVSQEHYPERSFKIYILNIPRWFDVVLKLVRPFLAQATQAKMNIYRSKYSEKLLADIDAEVLPERYGGRNETGEDAYDMESELRYLVYRQVVKEGKFMIGDDGQEDPSSLERCKTFIQEFEASRQHSPATA